MRTAIASRVLVLMALLLGWLVAQPSTVVALDTLPGEILAHPDQFDQQTVTVRGSVTNLRQTTSQRGHPYYTFDLDDGRRSIRIFSFWALPVSRRRFGDGCGDVPESETDGAAHLLQPDRCRPGWTATDPP